MNNNLFGWPDDALLIELEEEMKDDNEANYGEGKPISVGDAPNWTPRAAVDRRSEGSPTPPIHPGEIKEIEPQWATRYSTDRRRIRKAARPLHPRADTDRRSIAPYARTRLSLPPGTMHGFNPSTTPNGPPTRSDQAVMAYDILIHELLKALTIEDWSSSRGHLGGHQLIIAAMKKAAGELS